MTCSSCGRTNRAGARFCGGCGKTLAPRCSACGRELEPDARFCDGCGASIAAPASGDGGARKVVSIVFADLVGSTALHERLDPETARRFMDGYYQAMRTAVEAQRGTVTQLLGDGVKAVFGAPRVAEDDAIRAVRAAVGMQRAFRELAEREIGKVGKTGLRVAVNTGEVVASDATEIIGDPVNVAARLQEEARDGDVVIGESTRRLVSELVTLAHLGTFKVKGRAETVGAYRVVSLDRPAGAAATPFVGREAELRRLEAAFDAAVATSAARLVVILGSPGLGKSRLVTELARRIGEGATVLTARCGATGGTTFAPLAEALRALLELDDGASDDALRAAVDGAMPADAPDRARIAGGVAALLAGAPAPPEETFFVVRRFLAGLAAARPVVLAIDDLQWAEPLLLDLTEHLVQWMTEAPLLVVAAARPELRDARSSLAAPGGLASDVVALAGLDAGAAARLAANAIGADELPAAVAGRVLAASEGNPLFVGELVRMLVQDGALKREGDRWTAAVRLADLEMPPTIQALLAARIERLRPEERSVLERAAVVGRQFSRSSVAELLPRESTDLDARLESLRRSELIEPDTGWFLGEPALRFHHVLVRDAAYRRILKGTRAELHTRLADWIESRVGEAVEHGETIGWHLEQAHEHLSELGPVDERGRSIGERAARHLAAAGRRALQRDDVPLAASLLGRALARLDAADPARADLALDWSEALLAAGEVGTAARAIDELGKFMSGSDRLRAWHACFAGQLAALTDPQALRGTADAVAAAAETLASAGDVAGEAKAHSVHAIALARLGKVGACEAALDRALAAARRANDRRRANAVLAGAPPAALWGPSSVNRASGRCLDVVRVLRITQGAPAVEAVALRCQAVLEALRGRGAAARRMIASSRRLVEELGIMQRLLEADVFAGLIELLEGGNAAAERLLRTAYDGLREHGLGIDAAQAAAFLGRALLAQGRAAEAETLSHESEALAGDDLQAAIAWRGVRAEALARRGEHAAAVELARAAVDRAAATDALLIHADARLALAAALAAAGRRSEAQAEEARAIELWEAKGATLLAERARRGVARAAEVAQASEDRVVPPRPALRRVRANGGTATLARLAAAIAAKDGDTLPTLFADQLKLIDHPTGGTYDRQGLIASWRFLINAKEPRCREEPLATLGEALALCRVSVSASEFAGRTFDVGAYEKEDIELYDVDAHGQFRHAEAFAFDHLGDAIVRLYERYAELLPDGPEHVRAATTARSVAALLRQTFDPDLYATGVAPDIDFTDHRRMGVESCRGVEAWVNALRPLLELTDKIANRVDDVLALQSDAFLVHWTNFGTDRAGGGAYERPFLWLGIFGTDGLATCIELFEAEREIEALARFDELTAEPAARQPAKRRLRPNAATVNAARLDAAIAARDADALPIVFADPTEVIDHTTGSTTDRQGSLFTFRSLLEAEEPTYRQQALATLGESLALCRMSTSARGFSGRSFDVGAYEREESGLIEVDAEGRRRRFEIFRADHLGDALVRLYERYAELLPEGAERAHAAATARSTAAFVGPMDLDRYAAAFAPASEFVDHRRAGLEPAHGAEAVVEVVRSLIETTNDATNRVDDILALRRDAFLVRITNLGTQRAGGGAYERLSLMLWMFGVDGLATRIEQFDVDRDAEALARFDELTTEPAVLRAVAAASWPAKRRVRQNAATAMAARTDVAVAAGDANALADLHVDLNEVIEHTTGVTYDLQGMLASWRFLLSAKEPRCRHERLATLGDLLGLFRVLLSAGEFVGRKFDVGPYEREDINLLEMDADGRYRHGERFAPDHLSDAIVRLYERYAELFPEGSERSRAAATARSAAALLGPFDPDRFATGLAPAVQAVDHRVLGTWSASGAEAFRDHLRSLRSLADEIANRVDDVLALRSDAFLVSWTTFGTDLAGGGAFERPFLGLVIFGTNGLVTRFEMFDADRDDEALARFDELTAAPVVARVASAVSQRTQRRVRPNAATANAARLDAAIAARDADALPGLVAGAAKIIDHTTGVTFDRDGFLATQRSLLSARDPIIRNEPLATLGDSLALCRESTSASGFVGRRFDVGAYEREEIVLIEADRQGRANLYELFASNHLGDALVRLYERYAELLPDGPERARAATTARSVAAWVGPGAVDRLAEALAPDVEAVDHRILGTWSTRGAEAMIDNFRSMFDLTAEVFLSVNDVLALRSDMALVRRTHSGRDRVSGGFYERQSLGLWVFGADGLLIRFEWFDPDREDEALARFDELTAYATTPAI